MSESVRSRPHFFEGFIGGLDETEIDGAGEELLGAVDPARGQQFLRADQPQQVALLRSDEVLPALAAGGGEIGGAHVPAAGEVRQHGGVFVVRVRARS